MGYVEVLRGIRDELQWKLRESEDPKRDRDYQRQLDALDSAIAAAPQDGEQRSREGLQMLRRQGADVPKESP